MYVALLELPAGVRRTRDVEIATASGPVTKTIDVTKRNETFDIKVPAAPTGLTIDRQEKVIMKILKIK